MDISIFEIEKLVREELNEKYVSTIPKIVIEVDNKIEIPAYEDNVNYYFEKTQKLLDSGVEKVIWVIPSIQKVMVASPESDWITSDWNKEIEVVQGLSFSINQLLRTKKLSIKGLKKTNDLRD